MGKFKYSMQNILDIKIKLETQAKNEFSEANRAYLIEKEWLKRLSGSRRYFQFMIRPQRLHGHLKKLQKDFWIMNLLLWMRKEQSHMFFQIFLTESNS